MKIEKSKKIRAKEIKGGVVVMGVKFQSFVNPETGEPVFSQTGTGQALEVNESTIRRIRRSEEFKVLRGGDFPISKLDTEINSRPISVVTQADLVCIVQISAEKGNPIARAMQLANFATLLQESVDQALGVQRIRTEYTEAGTKLCQQLSQRRPYDDQKFMAIQVRNKHKTTYTHRKKALTSRGVNPLSQGHITRQDYEILFNKDTKELRDMYNIPFRGLIVDHLPTSEQATLSFGHVMQVESIEIKDLYGYYPIKAECGEIMKKVVEFRDSLRKEANNEVQSSEKLPLD